MPLPPRAFHPLLEVAIRWSVKPIDIVGWAIDGRIGLSAALPLVETKQNRPVEGLVEVCAQDVFDLFGTEAKRKACVRIQRFRRRAAARWERIIAPPDGVPLKPSGVVITRKEIERFEQEYPPSGLYGAFVVKVNLRSSHSLVRPRRRHSSAPAMSF